MNIVQQNIMKNGFFGLERETLRVDRENYLPAITDHPFAQDNPYISKDFCEAQLELITPVCSSTEEVLRSLGELDCQVKNNLETKGETLWMSSNPPAGYDPKRIRVAHFMGNDAYKETYRNYLMEKYGIRRMLFSGIHFNFSFSEDTLALIRKNTGETKDELYMKLAAYSMKYAWLITFLTAASPASVKSSSGKKRTAASARCSSEGYWNEFCPVLDYKSLDGYCSSIDRLVTEGRLHSASELYLPVRLKSRGTFSTASLQKGISHIELRMLDLNPLDVLGIKREDLDFIHLLLIMWAMKKPLDFSANEQQRAIRNMQHAALLDETKCWIENPSGFYQSLRDAALELLSEADLFFEAWNDPEILLVLQNQRRKVLNPHLRYAKQVESKTRCV